MNRLQLMKLSSETINLMLSDFSQKSYYLSLFLEKIETSMESNECYSFLSEHNLVGMMENVMEEARSSNVISELKKKIIIELDKTHNRKKQRDYILKKLVCLLNDNNIDYVIFKTFNSINYVGVDIDLIIKREQYWMVIKLLCSNGFISIDDPKKTYETGLMLRNNSIIVDLHTEIAAYSLSYIDPSLLFNNKKNWKYICSDSTELMISGLDSEIEAIVRMAHMVIKEAQITLGECYEISALLSQSIPNNIKTIISDECLKYPYFITKMNLNYYEINCNIFELFNNMSFINTYTYNVFVKFRKNNLTTPNLPIIFSFIALIDLYVKQNKLVSLLYKPLFALRYRMNVIHIVRKAKKYLIS
jgi:hypothetical protein